MNNPVERLGMLLAMTLDARAATERYMQVMETASTVQDPARPVSLPAHPSDGGSRRGAGGRRLRRTRARPSGPALPILAGVDLRLEPGETMALVGLTGSGKTTLLQLVPGSTTSRRGRSGSTASTSGT